MFEETNSHGYLNAPVEDISSDKGKFELESLEPRILLSADPVLAELARQSMADDDLSQADTVPALIEIVDAEQQTDAADVDDISDLTPDVQWPEEWLTNTEEVDQTVVDDGKEIEEGAEQEVSAGNFVNSPELFAEQTGGASSYEVTHTFASNDIQIDIAALESVASDATSSDEILGLSAPLPSLVVALVKQQNPAS
jgi:hypothetical protein